MSKSWITESNRLKHFGYAVPLGFFLTILCVLGCASGQAAQAVIIWAIWAS